MERSNYPAWAAFTVSPQSELIGELVDLPGVEFLDIRRSAAYTARYAFLSSVSISEGLLDLARNIPDSDRTTLASIEVPLSYSDELYHLKQHVEYVSRRLETDAPPTNRLE